MPTTFSYNYLASNGNSGSDTLNVRLEPYNVEWEYNMNTNVVDTIGGQVVQVLSVSISSLVLEGQFGKEGAFGRRQYAAGAQDREGRRHNVAGGRAKTRSEQWEDRGGKYGVGLSQMTEFFRNYFARSTQGGDAQVPGRYMYMPMTVTYLNRKWLEVIPTNFPSYRRSNTNFAPEWHIEFEVMKADAEVQKLASETALSRLHEGIGYQARNPFSDPLADSADLTEAGRILNQIASNFREMVPGFTRGELENMIWQGVSVPAVTEYRAPDPALLGETEEKSTYTPARSARSGR